MPSIRRKQVEIAWAMVDYFTRKTEEFTKNELCKEMSMNTETLADWLELYGSFQRGPKIREIKVNSKKIYEIIRPQSMKQVLVDQTEIAPTRGERRTKLATGLALLSFLNSIEEAFFRTSMENALGMSSSHSEEWIQVYKMFNQGPKLNERKKGRITYYRTVVKKG